MRVGRESPEAMSLRTSERERNKEATRERGGEGKRDNERREGDKRRGNE